ncbi:MAG: hypothetical protein GTN70_00350 [Deltaproteobacteria bacterium]|nr:hypothetical protein [Deltaproteobacteria bacterium]NIS76110.1 hypothetical protein [Deltaproteobacteria bacterium]
MGVKDKQLIEQKYGKLWTGKDIITIGDKLVTKEDALRAFDIWMDAVPIDLVELGENRYAFRYYDGDDRCVGVLEFDETFRLLKEHRAHIADFLEDESEYYELGIKAFMPEEVARFLRERYEKEGGEKEGDE